MQAVSSPFTLKQHQVRNRVVFPPVVCFGYAPGEGFAGDMNVEHYTEIARGGSGIVITEATAVVKDGRLSTGQLGVWSDEFIPGLSGITGAVQKEGALSLLQIHHAGLATRSDVHPFAKGPSANPDAPGTKAMTGQEVGETASAFISGAFRAQQAGFQGVELHGAHGYLLNQFASAAFNRRTDKYGGSLENNLRLATEIITGIREKCGPDFIIGYRLGANAPSLDDGILIAKYLEETGVDLLHVSHGGMLQNLPRPPRGFDYNWIVYSGTIIKRLVNIPVIVVNEIKNLERADWLIENEMADFTALGRPSLADPSFVLNSLEGGRIEKCLSCKPRCRWYESSSLCPARKAAAGIKP